MKAKIFLAILFILGVFAPASFVYAVPAFNARCDITANITSLTKNSITLKIYYVTNDSYCKEGRPIGSEKSYRNPTYSYYTKNSTKVSVGQMINATVSQWGDEHSNGISISRIKVLDAAVSESDKNPPQSLFQRMLNWFKRLFG